jgi:hypothetical protein
MKDADRYLRHRNHRNHMNHGILWHKLDAQGPDECIRIVIVSTSTAITSSGIIVSS